jgi:hypothetical protein
VKMVKSEEEVRHLFNEKTCLMELSSSSSAIRQQGDDDDHGSSTFLKSFCNIRCTFKDQPGGGDFLYIVLDFIPGAPLHLHFRQMTFDQRKVNGLLLTC